MARSIVKEHSFRGAKDYLTEKGFYTNCRSLVTEFNSQLKDHPNKLEEFGFIPEYQIPTDDSLRPRFDAYNKRHGIGVELEKREQMNIRSHLLFTEIAYLKEIIQVAVFIVPDRGKKGNFNRTKNELSNQTEIFTKYFPLTVPILLFGYQVS